VTKRETRRAKLLELWDDDEEIVSALKEEIPVGTLEKWERDEKQMQAEAVLAYVGSMEDFVRLHCVGCGKDFVSSYGRVTTCSNRCLKKALEDMGITWQIDKSPESRWRPIQTCPAPLRQEKENLVDYEGRLENYKRHLQLFHPVPLIVPSEVVEMLDNCSNFQSDALEPSPAEMDGQPLVHQQ
jgi:hypothetical protein